MHTQLLCSTKLILTHLHASLNRSLTTSMTRHMATLNPKQPAFWRCQVMSDQRDVAEKDQAKLAHELEKIKAWGDQVAELVSALEELSEYFEKYAASRPPWLGMSLPEQSLRQLSDHFHEVCPDMCARLVCPCCAWQNVLKHTIWHRYLLHAYLHLGPCFR